MHLGQSSSYTNETQFFSSEVLDRGLPGLWQLYIWVRDGRLLCTLSEAAHHGLSDVEAMEGVFPARRDDERDVNVILLTETRGSSKQQDDFLSL